MVKPALMACAKKVASFSAFGLGPAGIGPERGVPLPVGVMAPEIEPLPGVLAPPTLPAEPGTDRLAPAGVAV